MQITSGTVFDLDRGFVERDLYTDGAHFTASSAGGQTLDATGCYVIPGLVDVHFHGCVGEDFSDATPDGLQAMADYELSQGVTYICPAGMTLPEEQLRRICENAAAHRPRPHPALIWPVSIWRGPSCAPPKRAPRTALSSTIPTVTCSTGSSRPQAAL